MNGNQFGYVFLLAFVGMGIYLLIDVQTSEVLNNVCNSEVYWNGGNTFGAKQYNQTKSSFTEKFNHNKEPFTTGPYETWSGGKQWVRNSDGGNGEVTDINAPGVKDTKQYLKMDTILGWMDTWCGESTGVTQDMRNISDFLCLKLQGVELDPDCPTLDQIKSKGTDVSYLDCVRLCVKTRLQQYGALVKPQDSSTELTNAQLKTQNTNRINNIMNTFMGTHYLCVMIPDMGIEKDNEGNTKRQQAQLPFDDSGPDGDGLDINEQPQYILYKGADKDASLVSLPAVTRPSDTEATRKAISTLVTGKLTITNDNVEKGSSRWSKSQMTFGDDEITCSAPLFVDLSDLEAGYFLWKLVYCKAQGKPFIRHIRDSQLQQPFTRLGSILLGENRVYLQDKDPKASFHAVLTSAQALIGLPHQPCRNPAQISQCVKDPQTKYGGAQLGCVEDSDDVHGGSEYVAAEMYGAKAQSCGGDLDVTYHTNTNLTWEEFFSVNLPTPMCLIYCMVVLCCGFVRTTTSAYGVKTTNKATLTRRYLDAPCLRCCRCVYRDHKDEQQVVDCNDICGRCKLGSIPCAVDCCFGPFGQFCLAFTVMICDILTVWDDPTRFSKAFDNQSITRLAGALGFGGPVAAGMLQGDRNSVITGTASFMMDMIAVCAALTKWQPGESLCGSDLFSKFLCDCAPKYKYESSNGDGAPTEHSNFTTFWTSLQAKLKANPLLAQKFTSEKQLMDLVALNSTTDDMLRTEDMYAQAASKHCRWNACTTCCYESPDPHDPNEHTYAHASKSFTALRKLRRRYETETGSNLTLLGGQEPTSNSAAEPVRTHAALLLLGWFGRDMFIHRNSTQFFWIGLGVIGYMMGLMYINGVLPGMGDNHETHTMCRADDHILRGDGEGQFKAHLNQKYVPFCCFPPGGLFGRDFLNKETRQIWYYVLTILDLMQVGQVALERSHRVSLAKMDKSAFGLYSSDLDEQTAPIGDLIAGTHDLGKVQDRVARRFMVDKTYLPFSQNVKDITKNVLNPIRDRYVSDGQPICIDADVCNFTTLRHFCAVYGLVWASRHDTEWQNKLHQNLEDTNILDDLKSMLLENKRTGSAMVSPKGDLKDLTGISKPTVETQGKKDTEVCFEVTQKLLTSMYVEANRWQLQPNNTNDGETKDQSYFTSGDWVFANLSGNKPIARRYPPGTQKKNVLTEHGIFKVFNVTDMAQLLGKVETVGEDSTVVQDIVTGYGTFKFLGEGNAHLDDAQKNFQVIDAQTIQINKSRFLVPLTSDEDESDYLYVNTPQNVDPNNIYTYASGSWSEKSLAAPPSDTKNKYYYFSKKVGWTHGDTLNASETTIQKDDDATFNGQLTELGNTNNTVTSDYSHKLPPTGNLTYWEIGNNPWIDMTILEQHQEKSQPPPTQFIINANATVAADSTSTKLKTAPATTQGSSFEHTEVHQKNDWKQYSEDLSKTNIAKSMFFYYNLISRLEGAVAAEKNEASYVGFDACLVTALFALIRIGTRPDLLVNLGGGIGAHLVDQLCWHGARCDNAMFYDLPHDVIHGRSWDWARQTTCEQWTVFGCMVMFYCQLRALDWHLTECRCAMLCLGAVVPLILSSTLSRDLRGNVILVLWFLWASLSCCCGWQSKPPTEISPNVESCHPRTAYYYCHGERDTRDPEKYKFENHKPVVRCFACCCQGTNVALCTPLQNCLTCPQNGLLPFRTTGMLHYTQKHAMLNLGYGRVIEKKMWDQLPIETLLRINGQALTVVGNDTFQPPPVQEWTYEGWETDTDDREWDDVTVRAEQETDDDAKTTTTVYYLVDDRGKQLAKLDADKVDATPPVVSTTDELDE